MVLRYTYQIDLHCRRCGSRGIADVAQTSDELTNQLLFHVEHVTKGFYVSELTDAAVTTEISCTYCDVFAEQKSHIGEPGG